MMQEWTVQCNTEVKYGHILVVIMVYLQKGGFRNDRLNIFCVFILYANNVYCYQPKCFQHIIKVICYHLHFSVLVAKVRISATESDTP